MGHCWLQTDLHEDTIQGIVAFLAGKTVFDADGSYIFPVSIDFCGLRRGEDFHIWQISGFLLQHLVGFQRIGKLEYGYFLADACQVDGSLDT